MICSNTNITKANVTCPTYVFGNELVPELRPFSDPIIVWGRLSELEEALSGNGLPGGCQVLLSFTERVPAETLVKLNHSILERGVHMVWLRDFNNNLPELTGWPLEYRTCSEGELQLPGEQ